MAATPNNNGDRLPNPTWLAGCGNMGQAMIAGWRSAGIELNNAVVIRPSGAPIEGVSTVATFAEAGAQPKLVILAMKPQKLDEVAAHLDPGRRSALFGRLEGRGVLSRRQRANAPPPWT